MNATLAIDYIPLAKLTPYAGNSRAHSPEQVEALARSIRTYGFNNPVLIDGNGEIIAGHGRVQAAALAGLDSVPCIRLGHLSDAQRRAYVIADNRLGELSSWDMAKLASEIEELAIDADSGFDIADLGFDADAFAALDLGLDDEPTPSAAPPAKTVRAAAEVAGTAPTPDDYADIAQGATTPGEGKGIQYPLILQLNKATFQQWRAFKGKRSDSEAIAELLLFRDTVQAETQT